MNKKIRISAISYLNTFPFLYGIYNSNLLEQSTVTIDFPSACAIKLKADDVDLGIVPVASLPLLDNYQIASKYCISSSYVRSVMLFSEVPLKKIETILLDYQSMSSVNLTRILAEKFWNISPNWENTGEGYENRIGGSTAGVIIGDRALNLLGKYSYEYDLAQQWNFFSGLPFVFAVWAANKSLPLQFLKELDAAFDNSFEHLDDCLLYFAQKISAINYDAKLYLTQNIDFLLDEQKMKSIELYLNYLNKL